METIGSKRSYALIWCTPNIDDDDDDVIFKNDTLYSILCWLIAVYNGLFCFTVAHDG